MTFPLHQHKKKSFLVPQLESELATLRRLHLESRQRSRALRRQLRRERAERGAAVVACALKLREKELQLEKVGRKRRERNTQ